MIPTKPISELVKTRSSIRTYEPRPIDGQLLGQLTEFAAGIPAGPFGNQPRFEILAATAEDQDALKGLGTYGFIKDAPGFIVGALREAPHDLEDFGYLMERIILFATALGLGTCWLGGSFTKSRFAEKMNLQPGESVPAVASVGHAARRPRAVDALMRFVPGSDRRHPWERLFFRGGFASPLTRQEAGPYAVSLEMLRLAPSASNHQPWRAVWDGSAWHFYLQRRPGYRNGGVRRLWAPADMQRIDMGIALCHFELATNESGLQGRWRHDEPGINKPNAGTEYIASWVPR